MSEITTKSEVSNVDILNNAKSNIKNAFERLEYLIDNQFLIRDEDNYREIIKKLEAENLQLANKLYEFQKNFDEVIQEKGKIVSELDGFIKELEALES